MFLEVPINLLENNYERHFNKINTKELMGIFNYNK